MVDILHIVVVYIIYTTSCCKNQLKAVNKMQSTTKENRLNVVNSYNIRLIAIHCGISLSSAHALYVHALTSDLVHESLLTQVDSYVDSGAAHDIIENE